MRSPRHRNAAFRRQETPKELVDVLLDFLQRKFYSNHPINFAKDRRNLLSWVILWPAKWLQSRAVTIPPDQYRSIFTKVFLDADSFRSERITYLPAYLAKVIQSHFSHHGEAIYDQAKAIRTLADHSLSVLGKLPSHQPDPIRDLARAKTLLDTKKKAPKPPLNGQLPLFKSP